MVFVDYTTETRADDQTEECLSKLRKVQDFSFRKNNSFVNSSSLIKPIHFVIIVDISNF